MRRPALTAGELAVLLLLSAWALIPLAAGLAHVWSSDDVLTGVDGVGVIDHYQYLAWIREAGENGLIGNRFDVEDEPGVYLQPMWLVSGLLDRAGAGLALAFLLWKPVALLTLFGGFAAYVRRTVDGGAARTVALALALFYFPPTTALLEWAGAGSAEGRSASRLFAFELSPATYLWGYVQTALAVGLMPIALLAAERALRESRPARSRAMVVAATCGLAAAWFHPWQGVVLLAILGGLLAWGRGPHRALLVPSAATAIPLVYYGILARTDTAWRDGAVEAGPHFHGWLALALAPLAAVAIAGAVRRRGWRTDDAQERVLLLWPLATLLVYALADRTFYYNLLSGLTLPLAVHAVRAAPPLRAPGRAVVAVVLALATLPGLALAVDELREARADTPYHLKRGEADALDYLDRSPRTGSVLTRGYLGQVVPSQSGRRVYVGHFSWTEDYGERAADAERLFDGRAGPAEARAFVRESGAAFLLQDCVLAGDLRPLLGDLVVATRRFGCATVYELR